MTSDMKNEAMEVRRLAKEHTKWFRESLPLIASENLISPLAREMLITDLHNRYAEGLPGARYYQGNIFVDEIETKGMELARKLFGVEWADLRPPSGTVANIAVLFGLVKPGETMMTPSVADGAHISSAKFGAVGLRGASAVTYPFDNDIMNIDIDKADKLIRETKPKLALFGMSVFLFPTPLKDLRDALEETGCYVWYDAAHVLGLIAGGQFQDPLREGAEVMTGSTHKTLPGPQRGILLANPRNEKMQSKLNYAVFPGVSSNHHLHTMAALTITLAEHIAYGKDYAAQTVKNAQALAQAMYGHGMDVLCPDMGFTRSHTIAVDVRKNGGGTPIVEAMEKANIIANKNLLPWDDVNLAHNPSGIRLGVQELTRIGMKEDAMVETAGILKRIIVDREDPAKVREKVKSLKSQYTTVQYCFTPQDGYQYTDLV